MWQSNYVTHFSPTSRRQEALNLECICTPIHFTNLGKKPAKKS